MFRSLKRTHDLFLANQNTPVLPDETAYVLMNNFRSEKLFFISQNRDNMSRKIKAKDQYGTVLTLPKGMKPHVKSTAETADPTTEPTSTLNFVYSISLTIFFVSGDGKHRSFFYRYYNDDSFLDTSQNTNETVNETIPR